MTAEDDDHPRSEESGKTQSLSDFFKSRRTRADKPEATPSAQRLSRFIAPSSSDWTGSIRKVGADGVASWRVDGKERSPAPDEEDTSFDVSDLDAESRRRRVDPQRIEEARKRAQNAEKSEALAHAFDPKTDNGENWPHAGFAATGGSPRQLSFLIALGAMSGESAGQIEAAAADLQRRLESRAPARTPAKDSADAPPFALDVSTPRSQLLQRFRARATTDVASMAERLDFEDPADGPRVVWHAMVEIGGDLGADVRAWLQDLGEAPETEVRAAAGRTCGALALNDFTGIRRLFEAWRAATTADPLDALDAALGVAERAAAGRSRVADYVRELSERADYDDVFAMGVLAGGEFAQANPTAGFELLQRLISTPREDTLFFALRACIAWLAIGQEKPALAGRVWVELAKTGSDKTDVSKWRRAWLLTSLLATACQRGDGVPELFECNGRSDAAKKALGQLLNYVVFFPDHRIQAPELRPAARAVVRDLFRSGLEYPSIRQVAWPMFTAAISEGDSTQAERLRELMSAWRQSFMEARQEPDDVVMP
jgi:hypothetical protein